MGVTMEEEIDRLVDSLLTRAEEDRRLQRKVRDPALHQALQSLSAKERLQFTQAVRQEVLKSVKSLHRRHGQALAAMDARGIFHAKANSHRAHTSFLASVQTRINVGEIEDSIGRAITSDEAFIVSCEAQPPNGRLSPPPQPAADKSPRLESVASAVANSSTSPSRRTSRAAKQGKRRSLVYNRAQDRVEQQRAARLAHYLEVNEERRQELAGKGNKQSHPDNLRPRDCGYTMDPAEFCLVRRELLGEQPKDETNIVEDVTKVDPAFKHFQRSRRWQADYRPPAGFHLAPEVVEEEVKDMSQHVIRTQRVGIGSNMESSRPGMNSHGFGNTFGMVVISEVPRPPDQCTTSTTAATNGGGSAAPPPSVGEEKSGCHLVAPARSYSSRYTTIGRTARSLLERSSACSMASLSLSAGPCELQRRLECAWENLRVPYMSRVEFLCKFSSPQGVDRLSEVVSLLDEQSALASILRRCVKCLVRLREGDFMTPEGILEAQHVNKLKSMGIWTAPVPLCDDGDLASLSPRSRELRRSHDLKSTTSWLAQLCGCISQSCMAHQRQLDEAGVSACNTVSALITTGDAAAEAHVGESATTVM